MLGLCLVTPPLDPIWTVSIVCWIFLIECWTLCMTNYRNNSRLLMMLSSSRENLFLLLMVYLGRALRIPNHLFFFFDKIQLSLMINPQQIGHKRNISQYNKGNILQAHSQQHTNWWKMKVFDQQSLHHFTDPFTFFFSHTHTVFYFYKR